MHCPPDRSFSPEKARADLMADVDARPCAGTTSDDRPIDANASRNGIDVCMFITSLRAGGIKRVVLNLAGEFTRNGSSVELFVLDPQGPYADAVPEAVRLTVLEAR